MLNRWSRGHNEYIHVHDERRKRIDMKFRENQQLSDGHRDNLTPLVPIDLRRAHTVSELLQQMSQASFGARSLGDAAEIICEMVDDKDCLVVGTFSGAMTIAKMGLIICDMIDFGILDAIVSTGALISHGLVEAKGMSHFKVEPGWTDHQLFEAGYCRVYDSIELEKNLDDLEAYLYEALSDQDATLPLSSSLLCREIGRHLSNTSSGRGILTSAFLHDVPIFIPAFTDCELALDFALYNRKRNAEGKPTLKYDAFLDLEQYIGIASSAKKLGIITIGGGVPRNWAQQVGPFIDALHRRQSGTAQKPVQFSYGVRICPDPPNFGGLSGCTYSEGVSWGKFIPQELGGRYAEVLADATIAWPIIMRAVFERLDFV